MALVVVLGMAMLVYDSSLPKCFPALPSQISPTDRNLKTKCKDLSVRMCVLTHSEA